MDETVEKIRKWANSSIVDSAVKEGIVFVRILLKRLDAAEQHYENLDDQLQKIHIILGFDTNDPVESARQAMDEIRLLHQHAAVGKKYLRVITSYDYSLDCPYCTIGNDGVHEPGCVYQAIAKYLEGLEVAGGEEGK